MAKSKSGDEFDTNQLKKALKKFPAIVAKKKIQAKLRKKIAEKFDRFSKKNQKELKPANLNVLTEKSVGKIHPWRPCPLGQHWVITHPYHVRPSQKHPEGQIASQTGHCRSSPSKKDHLYKDDIIEISHRYFSSLVGPPAPNDLGFDNIGNEYDHYIRGWTQYWNEVLNPEDKLDPDLVKALIASESSFNPHAWNHLKGGDGAYGLMQVLNKSVALLKHSKELSNHFVNLSQEDMKDPNLSICAGIRWLFRKKQILESRAKNSVGWRDVIADYKGITPNDKRLMPRFDKYYRLLKE